MSNMMNQGEPDSSMPSTHAPAPSQPAADVIMVGDYVKGSKSGRRNGDDHNSKEGRDERSEFENASDSNTNSPPRRRARFAACESTSRLAKVDDVDANDVGGAKGSESGHRQNEDHSSSGSQHGNGGYCNSGRQEGNYYELGEGCANRSECGRSSVSDDSSDSSPPLTCRSGFAIREDSSIEVPFDRADRICDGHDSSYDGDDDSIHDGDDSICDDGDGGLAEPGMAENGPDMMASPPSPEIAPPLSYQMICLQKEMAVIAKTCLESLLRYTEACVDRGENLEEVRARAIEAVGESPPVDEVEAMVVMETVGVFERLSAVFVTELMSRFGGPENRATLAEDRLLLQAVVNAL